MKKILFLLICFSITVYSQSSSRSGLSFLKLGAGARNISMSDLGVVGGNDLTSQFYNPSLFLIDHKTQISFSHNNYFTDLSSEMFNASFNLFGLPFAVGINTTTISNIEIRTQPGDVEADFNAHYFLAGISSAFSFWENINTGLTVKYIYENLFTDEADGIGIDIGINYTGLMKNMIVGASIKNIGSMSKLRNQKTKMPVDFRAGAAYKIIIEHSKFTFNTIAGFQKYLDDEGAHLHFGGEAVYNESFSVRLGYITGNDSKNISTGFGILWDKLNIDYAYVPVKFGLGDTHIFTFIYTFKN